ncbi:GCC2 and GCC3 family protein [Acanthocheilonema viteae]
MAIHETAAIRETVPAVRVVRFQVDYPNASLESIQKVPKWNAIMRNSILASLRFINKHWLICPGSKFEKKTNDCGKVQVTGEIVRPKYYRINATFISERDPIRNVKVDATSTVYAVVQIGLRGGIFQYTNALKILGKPSQTLSFDEAFFCYRGSTLIDQDKCILCEPGHYHSLLSKKCELCPRDYYQNRSGRSRCHKCPQGYVTLTIGSIHATSCFVECSAGHFLNEITGKCESCGYLAYQPNSGSTNCLPCPQNTVALSINSTSIDQCIENCPAGEEHSSNGSCVPCQRGFFKEPNDVLCRPCDPAYITESVGSTNEMYCKLPSCKQGHYLNWHLKQCLNCSYGYYQDEVGSNSCKRCPSGTTTRILGATSIETCVSTNQCASGEHNCHWLAACIDLPDKENKPTYSCRCQPGFVGNGFTCTDICLNLCYNNAECIKTSRGEPRCICKPGYRGLRCEIKK